MHADVAEEFVPRVVAALQGDVRRVNAVCQQAAAGDDLKKFVVVADFVLHGVDVGRLLPVGAVQGQGDREHVARLGRDIVAAVDRQVKVVAARGVGGKDLAGAEQKEGAAHKQRREDPFHHNIHSPFCRVLDSFLFFWNLNAAAS